MLREGEHQSVVDCTAAAAAVLHLPKGLQENTFTCQRKMLGKGVAASLLLLFVDKLLFCFNCLLAAKATRITLL